MKNRILASLLIICMLLVMLPVTAAAADLTISTADELKIFADAVNSGTTYEGQTVVLANNITLSGEWTPIGNANIASPTYTGNAFKGTFDGGNNTISGLTNSLFGVVDGATVKNLVLSEVAITGEGERVGAAVRLMVGNATVSNIKVSGAVAGAKYVGGVVGAMTFEGTISNCINNATISGTTYNIGGIVGAAYYTAAGKTMTVSGCINNGSVSGPYAVGGIVGLSTADISDCTNTAAITASNMDIGGIVGEQKVAGSVIGCTNTGNVTNTGSGYGTGGIIGWVRYPGYPSEEYRFGEVIEVSGNKNSGAIKGGNDAGGIVGTVYNAAEVTDNENTASNISATTFAAGIVGNIQFTETVKGGIPQEKVNLKNNVSTTAIENISADNAKLYAHDNSSGSQDGEIGENADAWVAQVGGTKYATLQAAIDAASNGDTITILSDIELTEGVTVSSDKTVTIDLNGKTIDGVDNVNIAVMSYGHLTLKDSSDEQTGAIKAGKNSGKSGNTINICAGTFTMESGSIYSVNNAILVDEQAATVNIKGGTITAEPSTKNSAVLYVSSTSETVINITDGEMVGYNGILLWNNTTINLSGGSINAKGSVGIQGNGAHDNTEINISGDAKITGYYAAIYHPQAGDLNISDNAELTGWTGVVVKGGNINISGGIISGTGAADAYEPVSSGFKDTGDGLYVEHFNTDSYGTPTVTITGGSFTSTNASAVASYANTNNNVEALDEFISGGIFGTDVSDYLAPGYALESYENSDGNTIYGIVPATDGDTTSKIITVTFETDPTTATIVITGVKTDGGYTPVVIDNGNGSFGLVSGAKYTYTVSADGYESDSKTFTAGEADIIKVALNSENAPEQPPVGDVIIPGIILIGDTTATMMPEKDIPDYLGLYQMQLMAQNGNFTDVASSDWFYNDIIALVNKGVINGYPDGSFKPFGEVTWGEALKLVMKAVGYGDIAPTNGHWASGFMAMAIEHGLISGEVDLDAAITREEVANLTAQALKLAPAVIEYPFDDAAPEAAVALYAAGIIKGSSDNGQLLFRGESTIIRAEMAAIIWRVYCAR